MARRGGPGRSPPPPEAPASLGLVLLGEFGRAHGLRGELRLKSFTADPQAIAGYGPLSTADGRLLALVEVRPAAGGAPDLLVARIEGIVTREQAEALNGTRVFVPRSRLLPPADEDEFLAADLVGLAVEDAAGQHLGAVSAVPNYGGGDLIEIAPAGGGAPALLPFTRAFVPVIDLEKRRIVVEAPDGLFG